MSDSRSVADYIQKQGTIAALVNVVVNPLIAWLLNPRMEFVPVGGSGGLAVDLAVTSIVLSLLVTLFATRGARHDMDVRIGAEAAAEAPGAAWLSRLPVRTARLGLALGLGAAAVSGLAAGVLGAAGLAGLPFAAVAAVKAGYTGLLAYAVTRWVILRRLLEATPAVPGGARPGSAGA